MQTPVGARCPDCARLTRLPVFQVSKVGYVKAAAAGLVGAVVLGIVWGLIWDHLWGWGYLLAIPAGYAVGEVVSLAVNRKRGKGLQVVGGCAMAVCYASAVLFSLPVGIYGLLALAAGIFLAVNRFR